MYDEKNVFGVYENLNQASVAIQDLLDQGLMMEDIHVVATADRMEGLDSMLDVIIYIPPQQVQAKKQEGMQGFLNKMARFFADEEAHTPYSEYHKELMEGNVLIVVDRNIEENGKISQDTNVPGTIGESKETIKLHKQRLHVSKGIRQNEHVRVEKKVIEEVKRIEVPVKREELHVTRIKVDENGNEIAGATETEVIPMVVEEPIVYTEPILGGEVDIEKVVYTDVDVVKEKVLHEEILVDEETVSDPETFDN